MIMIRRSVIIGLAAAVLLTSGCAGDDDDAGDAGRGEAGAPMEAGAADEEAPEEPTGGQARSAADLLQVQQLIHTAHLSLEVPDVLAAVRAVERMATGPGGLVQSEQLSAAEEGGSIANAEVTIRVPPDGYEEALRQIADLGTLIHQNRNVKDVTREVVDVESRIATQRESIERVRAILSEATRIADVVTLEAELTRRQADLESLLAQQKALADQVDLATVVVSLVAAEEDAATEDDEGIGFWTGLTGGWKALVGVVVVLLTVLGALLPFAAVGVPLALLALWVLRVVRRSNQPAS